MRRYRQSESYARRNLPLNQAKYRTNRHAQFPGGCNAAVAAVLEKQLFRAPYEQE